MRLAPAPSATSGAMCAPNVSSPSTISMVTSAAPFSPVPPTEHAVWHIDCVHLLPKGSAGPGAVRAGPASLLQAFSDDGNEDRADQEHQRPKGDQVAPVLRVVAALDRASRWNDRIEPGRSPKALH